MSDSLLYITINGQISELKLVKKEKTVDPDAFKASFKDAIFTLQVDMRYKKKGDYKCKRYEGKMMLVSKDGNVLSQGVYGQSAWKTTYKN